jgi:hypothetical protein
MAKRKKKDEPTMLSTLQDILIFQMASAGIPQAKIRTAVGLDMNRVNRIASLVKRKTKDEEP